MNAVAKKREGPAGRRQEEMVTLLARYHGTVRRSASRASDGEPDLASGCAPGSARAQRPVGVI